ncbi:hypothetical protein LTR53_020518, partial [Teratosphaeriaceae sp. CCFEE 6253]
MLVAVKEGAVSVIEVAPVALEVYVLGAGVEVTLEAEDELSTADALVELLSPASELCDSAIVGAPR